MHQEAYEYHRSSRLEIMKLTQQAQERADRMHADAEAATQRARDEIAGLLAQRDNISRQLEDLSGVIDALSIPERLPQASGAPTPLPTDPANGTEEQG